MRRSSRIAQSRLAPVLVLVALVVVLTGCGMVSHAVRRDAAPVVPVASALDVPPAAPSAPVKTETAAAVAPTEAPLVPSAEIAPTVSDEPVATAAASDGESAIAGDAVAFPAPVALAMQKPKDETDEYDIVEYDPWEPFNEKMFDFNLKLDRHVIKPVAKVYNKVMPDELQRMISNAFDNLKSFPRMVNSVLQLKWNGAGREVGRFLINSTFGIGGLWDIARQEFKIEKSREDFGQTLGVWGMGPGPFLILPFFEPLTVRDAVGTVVDGFFDPLSYVLPLFPERIAMQAGERLNERSLNLELFQGFEETVIDFYSAVRHAYLERRRNLIRE